METKADIRKRLLKERNALPLEIMNRQSTIIQKKIMMDQRFIFAKSVYLYMDCKGEVKTNLLLQYCLQEGKQVYVPRIDGPDMEFYKISGFEDLKKGYFGILEPVTTITPKDNEGYMIVPGVAFSKERMRMGYGKGFYDRYINAHPGIFTCGICYDFQLLDDLPTESHDQKLDQIVTELQMIGEEKNE